MRVLAAAILLMAATSATAQVAPLPPPPGPGPGPWPRTAGTRVQSIDFVPDEVVQLQAAPGFQLTVELAQDEHVENVAVGDSGAWQVAVNHRGDRLFIKPLQAETMTNMVVITDTRLYSFELVPADASAPDLPYIVRFRYPSASVPTNGVGVSPSATAEPIHYRIRGTRDLRPSGMHDDGVHTYIDWPEDRPLAAIYAINERGQEALVNSTMRAGQIVIDSIHDQIVFRRDGAHATAIRLSKEKP